MTYCRDLLRNSFVNAVGILHRTTMLFKLTQDNWSFFNFCCNINLAFTYSKEFYFYWLYADVYWLYADVF
jgi:hypothetical protein